jgi:DNA integrity scanning protein DisA with diadenylate cyclase activity
VSFDPRSNGLDVVYGDVAKCAHCSEERKRTFEEIVQLGVEIAREGREGRKIGTLFVVGDVEATLARSRPLILDPLYGHSPELLHVSKPDFRETVKELAQLDGAFLVDDDGTFAAAGRYIDVDAATPLLPGLGTRHAAGASISAMTTATAVVVSQSSIVRVFAGGRVKAEIIPELFLMSREHLFAPGAAVRQLPSVGITMAVADDEAAA